MRNSGNTFSILGHTMLLIRSLREHERGPLERSARFHHVELEAALRYEPNDLLPIVILHAGGEGGGGSGKCRAHLIRDANYAGAVC